MKRRIFKRRKYFISLMKKYNYAPVTFISFFPLCKYNLDEKFLNFEKKFLSEDK